MSRFWLAAVSTAASATLLVLGMDYATLATTGDSLILGRTNRSDAPTVLTNTDDGPALRLKTAGRGSAALAVNGDSKVHRLNADELDGRTATDLASRAVAFRAGQRGDVIAGTRMWRISVPVGSYQVSFKAIVIPSAGDPQSPTQVVCGVVDLLTFGPRTDVYTADSATYLGGFPAIMSGAETARVRPGQKPGLVCTTAANTPGTDFTLFKPVTASFLRINSRDVRRSVPVPRTSG